MTSEIELLKKLNLLSEKQGSKLLEKEYIIPKILRRVVYNNILFDQRRELHYRIVNYYELKHKNHKFPDKCSVSSAYQWYSLLRIQHSNNIIPDKSILLNTMSFIHDSHQLNSIVYDKIKYKQIFF